MRVNVAHGDINKWATPALIVNLFEGATVPAGATAAVDDALGGAISKLIGEGEIRGKRGEMTLIHTLGKMLSSRVLVAGLGKSSALTLDGVRSVAGESCRYLRKAGVETVATIVHGAGTGGIETHLAGQAIAEGASERLMHPIEANEVFIRLTPAERETLRGAGYQFYDWGADAARFVAAWDSDLAEARTLGERIADL